VIINFVARGMYIYTASSQAVSTASFRLFTNYLSPSHLTFPVIRSTLKIIHIQKIHASVPQRLPDLIASVHWPPRLVPIPDRNTLRVRDCDLGSEQSGVGGIESAVLDVAKLHGEVGRGDWGDGGGNV